MSKSVLSVPRHLWEGDIPAGYELHLFVGRLTGQLAPLESNRNFTKFAFTMMDPADPTELLLQYSTMEAPGDELARWENVGDTVGIVMAHKGDEMSMVMAYDFTRKKYFGTGYYPHVKDTSPFGNTPYNQYRKTMHGLFTVGMLMVMACGIGLAIIGIAMYYDVGKTKQYKVLNPTDYRGETVKKIADWITQNYSALGSSGNPALDPSL